MGSKRAVERAKLGPSDGPSFAQRDRASGMGGDFDVFFVERAQEFVMSNSGLLSR